MTYKYSIFYASLLAGCLLLFFQQASAEDKITLSAGYDYSQGDYGAQADTIVKYIPLSIKLEKKRLAYKLTIPHITITGPGNLVGRDAVSGASGNKKITTESGLGDIIAEVSYNILPFQVKRPLIDITTKVKLPTADKNRGLGTGKLDISFQADALYMVEKTTLFGSLGYKIYGDTPGINFSNGMYYSLGANYPLNSQAGAGVILDYREASTTSAFEREELTVYINKKLDNKKKLLGYVVKGLSTGSPDWGVGISLSYLL